MGSVNQWIGSLSEIGGIAHAGPGGGWRNGRRASRTPLRGGERTAGRRCVDIPETGGVLGSAIAIASVKPRDGGETPYHAVTPTGVGG